MTAVRLGGRGGLGRGLYSAAQLQPMIRPATIAVVGVSETKDGFGTRALKNIIAAGRGHDVVAVNPRATLGERLFGVRTVARLEEIEGAVDCVLVAVPAAFCEAVVEQAAQSGCRSAIVFSSGFAEASAEGQRAQGRMAELARAHGMLLGGPNTAGVLNYRDRLPLTFMSDLSMELVAGQISIVSQSAGIATHLGHVRHRGIGVAYAITGGNSADVTVLDYVNFVLDDDATTVVALALEGIPDAAHFAALGRRSQELGKPIVMLKTGRTRLGGKAAVSHTGSLAGNHEVLLTAANQAGIIVVDSPEQLIDTATMFAKWSSYSYTRGGAAVLTTMGGAGVIAADAAEDVGVPLPMPMAATVSRLNDIIPAFAATSNPIDTTASPTDTAMSNVISVLAEDPTFSVVAVLTATTGGPSTAQRPQMIADTADRLAKPLCSVWLSSWQEMPGTEILDRHPAVAVFRSSQRCFAAIRSWVDWHERLAGGQPSPAAASGDSERRAIRDLLDGDLLVNGVLDEAHSRKFLKAAGIGVPTAQVVTTAADAAAAADAIGYPVVAKVVSADVPHKAAAGGVILGIRSAPDVAAAFDSIVAAVSAARRDARIDGVLIARSYDADVELMAGVARDPVFGHVILCGTGGSAVEEIADIARVVTPYSPDHLRDAVEGLRVHRHAAQKSPASAARLRAAHVEVVSRLAHLVQAVPEVAEIDVNPLVVSADGQAVALDALVVLDTEGAEDVAPD